MVAFLMWHWILFRLRAPALMLSAGGIAGLILCFPLSTRAAFPGGGNVTAGVTLGWEPSADPDITDYVIYYGLKSGQYQSSIAVYNTNVVTIPNLIVGRTYYFAAASVDSTGLESLFSNETSATVANPYTAVQGQYNGLFYEPDQVQPASSGSFTFLSDQRGAYSGKLLIGSTSYPFSGRLDPQCHGSNVVRSLGGKSLALDFQLGRGDQTDRVTGLVYGDTWVAQLLGDRVVFDSRQNRAPMAGTYTFIIPGQDEDPSLPGGDSYGSVQVSTAGIATFKGTLGDTTPVTQSGQISKDGIWPFYISLYSGKGCIVSWLSFTNEPNDDLSGFTAWIKPPVPNARYYPAGFSNDCQAIGSAYVRPAGISSRTTVSTNLIADFAGGDLAEAFSNLVTMANFSRIVNQGTNAMSFTISTTDGTFRGTVTDPATRKKLSFSGALFQKQPSGYGQLPGTSRTAHVRLAP